MSFWEDFAGFWRRLFRVEEPAAILEGADEKRAERLRSRWKELQLLVGRSPAGSPDVHKEETATAGALTISLPYDPRGDRRLGNRRYAEARVRQEQATVIAIAEIRFGDWNRPFRLVQMLPKPREATYGINDFPRFTREVGQLMELYKGRKDAA